MFSLLPPEVLLYMMLFLDIPDLTSLAQAYPPLVPLVNDPLLHRERIMVVTPSRLSHSLFGASETGLPLRPTILDLVRRNIIRGMGIERRWRDGVYFYSSHMVTQYESSMRLQWIHARNVLAHSLRTHSSPDARETFYHTRILPRDMSSAHVSPSIVSGVRRLRWALQRDRLAHFVKDRSDLVNKGGLTKWLEGKGRSVMRREDERMRLAVCPGIKGIVRFYEGLTY